MAPAPRRHLTTRSGSICGQAIVPESSASTPASRRQGGHDQRTTCSAPYEVRIGFESDLPLEQETDRLGTAGFDLAPVPKGRVPRIVLTDPDGEEIEIHPAPR